MPNAEWERLKQALKKPVSKESMAEAAEAFDRYRIVKLAKGKGSKPTLVSLGFKKTYPSAVPVDKIPDELAKNPEFYKLLSRVIGKTKT